MQYRVRITAMWCGFLFFSAMSIAISISLHPSRTLQALHYGLVVMLLLTALGIFMMPDVDMRWQNLLTAICILAASWAAWRQHRQRAHYRIMISPDGLIHLACLRKGLDAQDTEAEAVQLLTGSTIWPNFMLLRLRNEAGKIYSLALTFDSTSADNFRALAVAVRWIIHRKTPTKS